MSEAREERCSAHGKTAAEHIDGCADDCTRPPPLREGVPVGHCPHCATYGATGMHWDTCPYRGRNVLDEPHRMPWSLDLPGAPRDPELRALAGIVAELQRLDDAERGRILRYLNHRYMPGDRGPGSAPPRATGM